MKQTSEPPEDMRSRTRRFALSVISASARLPKSDEVRVMSRQFLRSGTSVGAHYREASRARSTAEFTSKLEGALQELDETTYWIELLQDSKLTRFPEGAGIAAEADELIRIIVIMVKNAKGH